MQPFGNSFSLLVTSGGHSIAVKLLCQTEIRAGRVATSTLEMLSCAKEKAPSACSGNVLNVLLVHALHCYFMLPVLHSSSLAGREY